MGRVKMDASRYAKIRAQIDAGIPARQIAKNLGCCDKTVKKIREGQTTDPRSHSSNREVPGWSQQVNWEDILADVQKGHLLSDLWNEQCAGQIGYIQFTREFHRQFPLHGKEVITRREHLPGEKLEVDYAGFRPEWIDPKTMSVNKMNIFVGSLCNSQKIFATASPTQSSEDFLDAHNQMFEYFGGVPKALIPDNLKAGVNKPHLYDPEINKSYQELADHYGTVVIPARVRRPKDKSLGELGVKLVTRFFRFHYRKHTFTRPEEIIEALQYVCEIINSRTHTRFKVSRDERFIDEKEHLKPLPELPFEYGRWEKRKLHPDCHLGIEGNYYSAPEKYRFQQLDVKIGLNSMEIFYQRERVALHKKVPAKKGIYVTDPEHLPEKSRAYMEATPQKILHQARFISEELHQFINELFNSGTLENLRRAQGFMRTSYNEINKVGRKAAVVAVAKALNDCQLWDRRRVAYYQDRLKFYRTEGAERKNRPIKRNPENPNLRHTKINNPKPIGE